MEEATLTSKSQITIPKAVREALGAVPGDKIRFVPAWQGFRLVVIRGDITSLFGVFKGRNKRAVTVEEMNDSIAQMGSRRERRR